MARRQARAWRRPGYAQNTALCYPAHLDLDARLADYRLRFADGLLGRWQSAGSEGSDSPTPGLYAESWTFRPDGSGHARFEGVVFGEHAWDFRWRQLERWVVELTIAGRRWVIPYEVAIAEDAAGRDVLLRARGRAGFWPAGAPLRRAPVGGEPAGR